MAGGASASPVAVQVGGNRDLDRLRLDAKILQTRKITARQIILPELLDLIARKGRTRQLFEDGAQEKGKTPGQGYQEAAAADGFQRQPHQLLEAIGFGAAQLESTTGAIAPGEGPDHRIRNVSRIYWLKARFASANKRQSVPCSRSG